MLDELMDMLVERLQLYEQKNNILPERIFVYRDGVSEVGVHSKLVFFFRDRLLMD